MQSLPRIRWLSAAFCFLCASAATAQDIVTGFEFNDTSGEFVLGVAPETATFMGGEAKSIGATGGWCGATGNAHHLRRHEDREIGSRPHYQWQRLCCFVE